jgi:methylated-DNA-protein-cysteine methyltransferase related protein
MEYSRHGSAITARPIHSRLPACGAATLSTALTTGRRAETHRRPAASYDRRVASPSTDSRVARIVERVREIPEGFVRTYGDIDPAAPRLVGRVLATTDENLPWHRVVRADGTLAKGRRQRDLLRREGIPLRGDGVDLRQARVPRHV